MLLIVKSINGGRPCLRYNVCTVSSITQIEFSPHPILVRVNRQEYLALTKEALGNPVVAEEHQDQGDYSPENMGDILLDNSPEALLSKAMMYTDKALVAGSELPLARLVKGQALVLRREFEVIRL